MKKDQKSETHENRILFLLLGGLVSFAIYNFYLTLAFFEQCLFLFALSIVGLIGTLWAWDRFSKEGRERKKRIEQIKELPESLISPSEGGVLLGYDMDLKIPVYLPDSIRSRHVHAIGATGSGKTVSVILNFLRQDVKRGLGAIVLDAKGDHTFIDDLKSFVPKERLKFLTCAMKRACHTIHYAQGLRLNRHKDYFHLSHGVKSFMLQRPDLFYKRYLKSILN